jgi:outer membrane protein assembly factor BamA
VTSLLVLISLVSISRVSLAEESSWRLATIPLVGYNLERGLGAGAYLAAFRKRPLAQDDRGVRYSFAVNATLLWTTRGYQNHRLMFDAPYLTEDALRLRVILGYETQSDGWYSGVGTPPALRDESLEQRAYFHELTSLWLMSSLTQPLTHIHPSLTAAIGWMVRDVTTTLQPQSLISRERPEGSQGGLLSAAQLSLSWDSRDREPDTLRGVWTEVSARLSHPSLLSDWRYQGLNFTHRHYIHLSRSPHLVYAYRIGIDQQWGAPPYFQRGMMGGTQWTELGGNSTLRGYKFGRFRSNLSVYFSQELRTRLTRLHYKSRPIDILATPLLDLGYLRGSNESIIPANASANTDWLWGSAGAGLRLVYDEGVVIRADLVWAYERFVLANGQVEARPQLGFFIMTGHSF